MRMNNQYEPIIGLEVHVELSTQAKMFCSCPADHFGREPNTITCPVCLGLPGALPVPNKKAVEWTILLGLALGCTINEESTFDRKHYFYPDLPKGYQISQYDQPLCVNGMLEGIRIRRVHLEEDTGKLMHATVDGHRVSLVDIVTEPDFRNIEEVDIFLKKLQRIIRYLGVSNADMEKGSMRIEPSVSIRELRTEELPNYRVEIKNINSFKFARRAIAYEIERQAEMLQNKVQPLQQTRGFVESKGVTVVQREKEEAHDYRYFPEPDIPPMRFTQAEISKLKSQIRELPDEKIARFMKQYGLSDYDATQLTETKERADYFESCIDSSLSPKTIANWIINKKVDTSTVSPAQLIDQIARSTHATSIPDDELEKIIKQVLAENPKAASDYKNGREQAIMFLVGQTMRIAKGKSSAEILKKRIVELVESKTYVRSD